MKLFVAEQKISAFKDTTVTRHETLDGEHGRIETRKYTAIHDVSWLQERHEWPAAGVEPVFAGLAVAHTRQGSKRRVFALYRRRFGVSRNS
ncbi:MAG: hypothetical protein WA733_04420 [Methylocystis sp.]